MSEVSEEVARQLRRQAIQRGECPKCGAEMKGSDCKKCGWGPSIMACGA